MKNLAFAIGLIVVPVAVLALSGCAQRYATTDYSGVPYQDTPSYQMLNMSRQLLTPQPITPVAPAFPMHTTCMPMGGYIMNCNNW